MRKTLTTIGIAAAAITASTGFALAAQATPNAAPPAKALACVEYGKAGVSTAAGNFMLWDWNRSACPKGTYPVSWGSEGAAGAQGPSGVVATSRVTATGVVLTSIGGSWSHGHVAVKQVSLAAGTYLVTLTGDFYKTTTTTATPDLQIQLNGADHQVTAYTGAFPYNAAEGTGATDGAPNGLEQTASIADTITVTSATTVEIDAFGYNADRSANGGGDFAVNASASFTQITPAS